MKPIYRKLEVEEPAPPEPVEEAAVRPPAIRVELPPPPDPGSSRDRREARVRAFLEWRAGRRDPPRDPGATGGETSPSSPSA